MAISLRMNTNFTLIKPYIHKIISSSQSEKKIEFGSWIQLE